MLDFTDGTVWFLYGFAATVVVALLCGVVCAFGMGGRPGITRFAASERPAGNPIESAEPQEAAA